MVSKVGRVLGWGFGAWMLGAAACGHATPEQGAAGSDGVAADGDAVLGEGAAVAPGGASGGLASGAAVPAAGPGSGAADAGSCGPPRIVLPPGHPRSGGRPNVCTGQVAATTFRGALCTCQDANLQGYLRTRGYDSRTGPIDPQAKGGGGAAGINRRYAVGAAGANAGFTDIGGSFSIAGGESMSFAGAVSVQGDFRAAGRVEVAGYTTIARDAWFGQDVSNAGFATVGGNLRITGKDTLPLFVKGTREKTSVTVAPPCDCEGSSLLPVGAIVDGGRATNDNARIGLSKSALSLVIGYKSLTLPCGSYYLDAITGAGMIVLDVKGRVALFVGGDAKPTGNFEVRLAPGAELDLFVGGRLVATGRASFGEKARPYASRIYVASGDDVQLTGASEFVGNLYAPWAKVQAIGYLDVWGAVFSKDFLIPGYANLTFDRAILDAGQDCDGPPPSTCTQCGTCTGGTACVNGSCQGCEKDSDCCGQNVCIEGRCRPVLY